MGVAEGEAEGEEEGGFAGADGAVCEGGDSFSCLGMGGGCVGARWGEEGVTDKGAAYPPIPMV